MLLGLGEGACSPRREGGVGGARWGWLPYDAPPQRGRRTGKYDRRVETLGRSVVPSGLGGGGLARRWGLLSRR